MKSKTLNAASVATDYYGTKASVYDKNNEHTVKWNNEQRIVENWLSTTQPTSSVLDIPCGTGRFFDLYERRYLFYTGIDMSTEMLSQAKAKASDLHCIDLIQYSIFNIHALKRKWQTSICVRLLNFFTTSEAIEALDILCKCTSEQLIFSMRTGDSSSSTKRCNVHDFTSIRRIINNNNFFITSTDVASTNNYKVYKAIKAC